MRRAICCFKGSGRCCMSRPLPCPALPGPTICQSVSSLLVRIWTMRSFFAWRPGWSAPSPNICSVEPAEWSAKRLRRALHVPVPDDQRDDGGEIRQNDKKLIRQAWIECLQSDLRRFGKTEAERGEECDQRTLAAEHDAGDSEKSTAGHHAFNEGVDLHYGEIRTAKTGSHAAEKNASSL